MDNKYKIEAQNSRKAYTKGQQCTQQALQLLARLKARRQKQIQAQKISHKQKMHCLSQQSNPQQQLIVQICYQNELSNNNENSMLRIWESIISKTHKQNSIVNEIVTQWNESYKKLQQQNISSNKLINKINLQKNHLSQKITTLEQKLKILQEEKYELYTHVQQKQQILIPNQQLESQSNLLSQNDENLLDMGEKTTKQSQIKYFQIIIENLQSKIQEIEQDNHDKDKKIIEFQKQIQSLKKSLGNKMCSPSDCETISFGNLGQQLWINQQEHQKDDRTQEHQLRKFLLQQKFLELEDICKKLEEQLVKERNQKNQLQQQNDKLKKINKQQKNSIYQLTKKSSRLQLQLVNIKEQLQQQISKNDYNLYKINYLQKQHDNHTKQLNIRLKKTYQQSSITKDTNLFRRFSMDKNTKIHTIAQSSTFDSLIN